MSKAIKLISDGLPRPGGHYSHAVVHGDTVYIAGQLGRDPSIAETEAGDISTQTRRCLTRIAAALRAAGSDLDRLLKVTIYISDLSHWPAVNAVYAEMLGDHRPARAVVPVGHLHFGALLEIDAIAAAGKTDW
jgi:2-iminobutanoate/2-iminopropanoate deaminase